MHLDKLALLEVGEDLGVWEGLCVVDSLELLLGLILDVLGLLIISTDLQPSYSPPSQSEL